MLAALLLTACARKGTFTWVNELRSPAASSSSSDEYLINSGDTVNIRVFEQEAMSSRVKVRADGKVSLPIIGDTEVRGKRPSDLARELESKLKEYMVTPRVTVNIDEFQAIAVSVLGEVVHPGSYPLDANAGVLQALASAGGMTEFASRDRIFVLRRRPTLRRVRFTFDMLSQNEPHAAAFVLQAGDVVVVE